MNFWVAWIHQPRAAENTQENSEKEMKANRFNLFSEDRKEQTAGLLNAMGLVRSTQWKYIHKLDELDYNIHKNNLLYSIWYNAFRDD